MPIVAAALMPHGSEAIPELNAPNFAKFRRVSEGLDAAAEWLSRYPARTAVVLTPHGLRADNMITVSISETVRGILESDSQRVDDTFPVNRALAQHIAAATVAHDLPTASIAYGASSGPFSQLPLDWGAQVPLHFLSQHVPDLATVVMTPSRAWPLATLYRLGEVLWETLEEWSEPVWLIASADMAHAHDAQGPYGFHPAAAAFDAWFQDVVERQDWAALTSVDMDWVQDAKPDALWQMVILAGALNHRFQPRLLGYDCPTYFGMMNAAFIPDTLP
ncbi:MAG: extradiol ring-cleavage dioxygenase [Firmicutes bacterium]|nr:extradiol ring-cleavage dioxygenase [Bacillota bacterium]